LPRHVQRVHPIKQIAMVLFWLALLGAALGASAFESVRDQEIRDCRRGELATWGDGQDRTAISPALIFSYNPAAAPPWFSEAQVAAMVSKAASAWSQCGVGSQVLAWSDPRRQAPGVIVVQWSDTDSGGNFGLANLDRRSLSLGPKAFELLRSRNPSHDARETLQMVISHEMGHVFGLMAHSRRCVDVLSYYHNGKGEKCFSRDLSQMRTVTEYRHVLPTACDIARCRQANGKPPLAD
jgi:hypothetical protein